MEQAVNAQPETGRSDKQRGTQIFLIFAIIVVFVIGALLYFNILPSKPLQSNNKLTNDAPTVSPKAFQYDTVKAKTLLTQYIKDTIKPSLLPTNIEVKQGLSPQGKLGEVKYEFGSSFVKKEATIAANFYYKNETNISDGYMIFVQPKDIAPVNLTTSMANSLLSSYFIKPYSLLDCGIKKDIFYCEKFQIIANGKAGYGIFSSSNGTKIYNCFVPKESSLYKEADYCLK